MRNPSITACLLILIAAEGLSACSGAARRARSAGEAEVLAGVVVTERRAQAMCEGRLEPAPTGFWTPERGQAAALERSIDDFLLENAGERSPFHEGIEGMSAQYIGVLRGDRELILATFSCEELDPEERCLEDDGPGGCRFSVIYDPALDEFDELTE